MSDEPQQQVEGLAPLLEPAVLVSQNCPECRGTGFRVVKGAATEAPWLRASADVMDVPRRTVRCERCEGGGREVSEVPISEFVQLLQRSREAHSPSPSELRRGGAGS